MENEILNEQSVSGKEEANDVAAYIETIKDMRENYRPKEELEAKDKQISQLLDALRNGKTIEEEPEKPVDLNELVKQVRGEGEYARQTDVEWMDAVLKLRDEAINIGFSDPMAGFDTENNPLTDGKLATSEKVYRGLSEMVEASQGNSYVFHNEYDRYVDDPITSVATSSKNKNIRRI